MYHLFLRNSPDGVATVYDLGFVVDCCRIDPLSDHQEAKLFLLEIMVVILWFDGVCQISPLSFSSNLFFYLDFSVRDSFR